MARVCAFKDDAGGNFVAFLDRILDVDPRIRECRTHVPPERFEFGRSVLVGVPFTQPVANALGCEQLVYHCLFSFVPDFVEPALND